MSELPSTSKNKVKNPVEPKRNKDQQPNAAKSSQGKKNDDAPENPQAGPSNAWPSASPPKKVIETMSFEPSAPPLELFDPLPVARKKNAKSKLHREILKNIRIEDKKYVGIYFDVPPPDWSKEDEGNLRAILRQMSVEHKKHWNTERIRALGHEVRDSGPLEMALARDIIALLQKNMNLVGHMKLPSIAFSTFSNKSYNWMKVSELMDHKFSPAECEEFWFMEMYPRIKNMEFSPELEVRLMERAIVYKFQHWDAISEPIFGYNQYQCYMHFRRNLYQILLQSMRELELGG